MTRSFSVLQLAATSGADFPFAPFINQSTSPRPRQQKREGQKPAGWGGEGGNTQKKVVVLHKRGFSSQSCHAAEPLTWVCGPAGKRGLVCKPREGSTELHLLYRRFSKPLGCKQPCADLHLRKHNSNLRFNRRNCKRLTCNSHVLYSSSCSGFEAKQDTEILHRDPSLHVEATFSVYR